MFFWLDMLIFCNTVVVRNLANQPVSSLPHYTPLCLLHPGRYWWISFQIPGINKKSPPRASRNNKFHVGEGAQPFAMQQCCR